MTTFERYAALAARLAIATIFVVSGYGKLAALDGTAGFIASQGLPAPMLLAFAAGAAELLGGLALAAGLLTRWAALGLVLFLVPATVLFHSPAGLEPVAAHMQLIQIYKNLAIAGGLLALSAFGPGPLTLRLPRAAAVRAARPVRPAVAVR